MRIEEFTVEAEQTLCVFAGGGHACIVCGYPSPDTSVPRSCPRGNQIAPTSPLTYGPGTELSKLLKRFGIEPTPTCACRAKAAEMDALGCDECERPERIAEVVAVMRAEAEARGLPFLDVAGRLLVKRAIRNARRNA
jgi:hypothetical protein